MKRLITVSDANGHQTFDETSLPLIIGTSENAHVLLQSGPKAAAYVAESGNHLYLQPAQGQDSLAIYHNDEPISQSVWLKSGDITRFGDLVVLWHTSGHHLQARLCPANEITLFAKSDFPVIDPNPKPRQSEAGCAAADMTTYPVVRNWNRPLIGSAFLVLLVAAIFVLWAKPLIVTVTPNPEHLSVSGFPPVIEFGGRFLGIPGSYVVHASRQGYRPLEETILISQQGGQYRFALEELPGLVDVSSNPQGARLLLNGREVGKTPLHEVEIPVGQNVLRFHHSHYLPVERVIEVHESGEFQRLHVEMQPAWAQVLVQSNPPGATLTIDGQKHGQTPIELELLAGEHQFHLTRVGFVPLEVSFAVTAGQNTQTPVYTLDPSPATINIESEPTKATITVNGEYRGQTPLQLGLPSGQKQEIRAVSLGFFPQARSVLLKPGDDVSIAFKLKPQLGTVFISSSPANSTLYIDGKVQPQSTGSFRLPTRPHTLELRAKGFQTGTRKIIPHADYSQRVEIGLVPDQPDNKKTRRSETALTVQSGLGQKLILVHPEPFLMGASRKEPGRRANEAEHQVVLKRPFYISEREVSNAEFRRFRAGHESGTIGNHSMDIDSHPVVNLSWEEAVRFLNWLSKLDGLPPFYEEINDEMVPINPAGPGYRLPTEAEWEFVARKAGRSERTRYPWRGSYPPKESVGNFADESARHLVPIVIDGFTDGFAVTSPTGVFPANPIGVFDMGGNAAEWCHDYYSADITLVQEDNLDPMGGSSGTHHVVRGSSWHDASITELRFSYRRYSQSPSNDIGFRIARYAQ